MLPALSLAFATGCSIPAAHLATDPLEQAVLNGLQWAAALVAEDRNLDPVATDFLLMLRELDLNPRHSLVRREAHELEEITARRIEQRLREVFPATSEGRVRFLAAAPALLRHTRDPARLRYYYANALADIGLDQRARFTTALADLHYRDLTHIVVTAWFVDRAARDPQAARLALPPNLLGEFTDRLQGLQFVHDSAHAAEFSRQNYFVTHLVFVLTDFGASTPPDTALSRRLQDYLLEHFDYVRNRSDDNDLLAEFVHGLKIYGHSRDPRVTEATRYLLGMQNPDGSFTTAYERGGNTYDLFHPTWTAITALNYSSIGH